MTLDRLQSWWQAVSLLDPLNWAVIALVLFGVATVRHSKTYRELTLPNKEEVADIFISVGTIYGVFNIAYVVWMGRPFTEAKSGIFYLFAALMGTVVEKAAKLGIGVSVAPTKPGRRKKAAAGHPVSVLPPPPQRTPPT